MREIVLCTWYTSTVRWITLFGIVQYSIFVCPFMYDKIECRFGEITEIVIADYSMRF